MVHSRNSKASGLERVTWDRLEEGGRGRSGRALETLRKGLDLAVGKPVGDFKEESMRFMFLKEHAGPRE